MTEAAVYAGLTEIFRDLLGDDTIILQPTNTAADIDGWDSFNNLNIIAAAEQRFDIKITAREIENLENVGALVDLIIRKSA